MDGPHAGEVRHLLTARNARGCQHGARFHRSRGGQQPAFADLSRHVVMSERIAERSGHPAAAGVEIDDGA